MARLSGLNDIILRLELKFSSIYLPHICSIMTIKHLCRGGENFKMGIDDIFSKLRVKMTIKDLEGSLYFHTMNIPAHHFLITSLPQLQRLISFGLTLSLSQTYLHTTMSCVFLSYTFHSNSGENDIWELIRAASQSVHIVGQ